MTDKEHKEELKRQAVERANSYRAMINSWAWKDLIKRLQEEKESKTNRLFDGKKEDFEVTKGFILALKFIDSEIGFILAGGSNAV
jgi:hypothetical protein